MGRIDDMRDVLLPDVVGQAARATEAAALNAYKWMGKGDKESGDFAA